MPLHGHLHRHRHLQLQQRAAERIPRRGVAAALRHRPHGHQPRDKERLHRGASALFRPRHGQSADGVPRAAGGPDGDTRRRDGGLRRGERRPDGPHQRGDEAEGRGLRHTGEGGNRQGAPVDALEGALRRQPAGPRALSHRRWPQACRRRHQHGEPQGDSEHSETETQSGLCSTRRDAVHELQQRAGGGDRERRRQRHDGEPHQRQQIYGAGRGDEHRLVCLATRVADDRAALRRTCDGHRRGQGSPRGLRRDGGHQLPCGRPRRQGDIQREARHRGCRTSAAHTRPRRGAAHHAARRQGPRDSAFGAGLRHGRRR